MTETEFRQNGYNLLPKRFQMVIENYSPTGELNGSTWHEVIFWRGNKFCSCGILQGKYILMDLVDIHTIRGVKYVFPPVNGKEN